MECPVRSFVKYLRRLNPNCNKLFQKVRKEPVDRVYYDNVPLGHNRLGSFMPELSKAAKLSQMYTNHSLRATTVHVLDSAQIPSRHIMTVTGHKAETSLKTYSGKTDESTKRRMSEIINKKLETKSKNVLVKKSTNVIEQLLEENDSHGIQLTQLTSSQTETFFRDISSDKLPVNENTDTDDKENFLNDFMFNDQENSVENPFSLQLINTTKPTSTDISKATSTFSTNTCSSSLSCAPRNLPMPVFNNCSNITVNFMLPFPKQ